MASVVSCSVGARRIAATRSTTPPPRHALMKETPEKFGISVAAQTAGNASSPPKGVPTDASCAALLARKGVVPLLPHATSPELIGVSQSADWSGSVDGGSPRKSSLPCGIPMLPGTLAEESVAAEIQPPPGLDEAPFPAAAATAPISLSSRTACDQQVDAAAAPLDLGKGVSEQIDVSLKADLAGHGAAKGEATGEQSRKGTRITPSREKRNRSRRLFHLLNHALSAKEVAPLVDDAGYIPLAKLFRLRPELQHELSCQQAVEALALDQAPSRLCLDATKQMIRLRSVEELIRSEVVCHLSNEAIPVKALVAIPALRALLSQAHARPAEVMRRALTHEDSPAVIRDGWVTKRPRAESLRRAIEELFSDGHLAHDAQLKAKIKECSSAGVPLAWLRSHYARRFDSLSPTRGNVAKGADKISFEELCEALQTSDVVHVDPRRLTVVCKRVNMNVAKDILPAPTPAQPELVRNSVATTSTYPRAATQLRNLLDYYFEPFTLQHNRFLLDLLASYLGSPAQLGPWVASELLRFRCKIDDLVGLGRIASALAKLEEGFGANKNGNDGAARRLWRNGCALTLPVLKHLRACEDGALQLSTAMEVRSFVAAEGAPPGAASAAARYLGAAREQRGDAPAGHVSVLSCAIAGVLTDETSQGAQRRSRMKRQLLVHRTDLVCLQGLDPNTTSGAETLAALTEEGYSHAYAASGSREANAIFWDRSRWELVQKHKQDAAIGVELRAVGDSSSATLRVVCFRPRVPYVDGERGKSLKSLFGVSTSERTPLSGPLLVCADFTLLGGAEGAPISEELAGLSSAAFEVLGEEIATVVAAGAAPGGEVTIARCPASGLNKLRSPDAVLFAGMAPVAVLSGHTEGYLATMALEEALQQFPALRMPIVAAFDRRHLAPADVLAPPTPRSSKKQRRVRL